MLLLLLVVIVVSSVGVGVGVLVGGGLVVGGVVEFCLLWYSSRSG